MQSTSKGRITQITGAVVDVQFDGRIAVDPERAAYRKRRQAPRSRSRAASRRKHRAHDRHGLPPKASCAAQQVTDTGAPITVPVGPETLGRIFNVIGEPIDERGPVKTKKQAADSPRRRRHSSSNRPSSKCSSPASRSSICWRLIRAAARSACSAVPASARRFSSWNSSTTSPKAHGGFSVFAGVGERTREGNDLYHEMIESGVIKTDGPGSKAALVYGQMNEPPGARARVGADRPDARRIFPRRRRTGRSVLRR